MLVRLGCLVLLGGVWFVGCTSSSSSAAGADGPASDGGAASATSSDGGGVATQAGPVLPPGTLLYKRSTKAGNDVHDAIVARDLASGQERVVTDLTGDGSTGWEIRGFSLSPDRRRIALASLYAPTKEDNATGLATRAIWTLATDGTDFRRLTPTVENDSGGRQTFSHEVGEPEWTADGTQVVYDFGTYWYEGGQLKGGSFPFMVSAAGGIPSGLDSPTDCGQVVYPSRHPTTGELLFVRDICIPGQGEGDGLYVYPTAGSKSPKKLVASSRAAGNVDLFLAKAAWYPDGSGFGFIGGVAETDWRPSLLAYDAKTEQISLVVAAPDGTIIERVAVAPDATKAVYCLRQNTSNAEDLHLLDLTTSPPADTAITTDGQSCDPSF